MADRGGPSHRAHVLQRDGAKASDAAPLRSDAPLVPRIVHQTWKTRSPLPAWATAWHASWSAKNPGWEVRVWGDDENLRLMREHFPRHVAAYLALPHAIQRADVARLAMLHAHGGVYVDLDYECLRPFEPLRLWIRGRHVLLVKSANADVVTNSIMVGARGHPLWAAAIERALSHEPRRWYEPASVYVLRSTGPKSLTDALKALSSAHARDVVVAKPEWFAPFSMFVPRGFLRTRAIERSRAFAAHHHQCSWTNDGAVLRYALYGAVALALALVVALVASRFVGARARTTRSAARASSPTAEPSAAHARR